MKKNITSVFKFSGYIVKRVEFDNNIEYNEDEGTNIDFDISVDFDISENQEDLLVILHTSIFDNPKKNNYPFKMKIELIGMFTTDRNVESIEKFKPNAVAILFPYVRAIVSSYTANANITPLVLPTININAYLKDKQRNTKK